MISLVDIRISNKCERELLKRGFKVIKMPPSKKLPVPIASHPDILTFYHENRIICSAEYCEEYPYIFSEIREFSSKAEIKFTSDVFSEIYPYDAIFNALTIGKRIFLKKDTVSESISDYADKKGLKTVNVKQGYPACTTLSFGNSAITSDQGMARTLEGEGIRVTLIRNGDISLSPYDFGFIGGAAGVVDNTVYFLGDIQKHQDYEKIRKAIQFENFKTVSLSDDPLTDLGRIIFID